MATETTLFIRSQLREDADPIALWNADYTFLNEALARHYGITGVDGPEFRRVPLKTPERYGLLGQASILMITSRHNDGPAYTSPAARSMWIRNHFLGAPAPRPFPGAQPVSPDRPITPQTRTLPDSPCLRCHQNFFPLAYPLENFDAIGRWRTVGEGRLAIDASGSLPGGTAFNGVSGLRNALLGRPDVFVGTLTEKLLTYALGRGVDYRDAPAVRQIRRDAETDHYRISTLMLAIARSTPFQMRVAGDH